MHNIFHLHGFSILCYFLDSIKFMKVSLKVSFKYFNEIFTQQNFMTFFISTLTSYNFTLQR